MEPDNLVGKHPVSVRKTGETVEYFKKRKAERYIKPSFSW